MDIKIVEQKISQALDELYNDDFYLFDNDLCERCICHRFAICLEKQNFGEGFTVDCEYNRAYDQRLGGIGTKKITSKYGNSVDIVITKRNDNPDDDLVCFETKKWNNDKIEDFEEDKLKLSILTGHALPRDIKPNKDIIQKILKDKNGGNYRFNYQYGFFITWGQRRKDVEVEKFVRNSVNNFDNK